MPASPRSRSGALSNITPADTSLSEGGPSEGGPSDAGPSEAHALNAAAAGAAPAKTPRAKAARANAAPAEPELREGVDDLSFREAQVALELVLSQLQASDLDVEAMVELHRRGQVDAERCETLLRQVEQEVQLWDPDAPDAPASPYLPG